LPRATRAWGDWLGVKMVRMFLKAVFLFFMALPCLVDADDYAVTNIRVVNDRWPDAGSPESFGRDAIRLAGAETPEEQAIAVWRFIQQVTEVGTVPKEPAYGNFYILSPEKLLNVYGVHWCDGLSRIMTMTWRALGYRADKLYKFGHTLADIHYRDADGVERWHVFDLSQHWYVYDRSGAHIATKEELALDHSLQYYPSRTPIPDKPSPMQPSWVHAGHLNLKPHAMGISLRLGERIEFLFGNEGKPYMNLFPAGGRRDFEHGPYPLTYGNGRLITRPQVDAMAEEDVLSVEIPYVISAAFLDFRGAVETPGGSFRISLSTDGGTSWKTLWQTEAEHAGAFHVEALDFCPPFNPHKDRTIDRITPFGRYDYKLKVELVGGRLDDLEVTTVFQHNLFALPMLWPGVNRMSVGGAAAPGTGLKITRRWDDSRGQGHRHEQIFTALPAEYVIEAKGQQWQDVRSRSMSIESVTVSDPMTPSVGHVGTETSQDLPYPTVRSIGKRTARQPQFERDAEQLADALQRGDRSVIADRIVALAALGDPRGAPLLARVVIKDATSPAWHKLLACQALYQSIGEEALPVLMRVLERDPDIVWAKPAGKWTADAMWLHTAAAVVAILVDVGDFPEKEKVADLIAATLRGERTQKPLKDIYRGGEIAWGLMRALGHLGGERHVDLLRRYLADKSDEAAIASEALIRIGDPSVLPDLIGLLHDAQYPPVRTAAIKGIGRFGGHEHAAMLYPFLEHWDEDFRAAAAAALGDIGNREAIAFLQDALEVETFPWVREVMRDSFEML
jgi:hypothetical protein